MWRVARKNATRLKTYVFGSCSPFYEPGWALPPSPFGLWRTSAFFDIARAGHARGENARRIA